MARQDMTFGFALKALVSWFAVAAIFLGLGVACSPAPRPNTTLAVGDSITFGIDQVVGYGRYLTLPGPKLIGGPGQGPTKDPWAYQISTAVSQTHPSTVVIQACCNGYSTFSGWVAALRHIDDAAGSARVIAVTTPLPESNSWFGYVSGSVVGANRAMRQVASERRWKLVDLAVAWPPGTPGVHTADGLHLTPAAAQQAAIVISRS